MNRDVDLSVIIPAYNEEHRLPAALPQLSAYLEGQHRSFELILVNDGSTDATLAVMEEAASRLPYVRVVTRPNNRGKGRSVAEGVAVSRGNVVLVSDADLSTPISELDKLERAIVNGADVAIASRAHRESQIEIHQPPHRVLMGKAFNLMVQAVLLPGVWDTQCGFKLYRGDVARRLFADLRTDGFAFDAEVLYAARRNGYRIVEVPVRWLHSAPSRVAPIKHSLMMFGELVKIRLGPEKQADALPARELPPL